MDHEAPLRTRNPVMRLLTILPLLALLFGCDTKSVQQRAIPMAGELVLAVGPQQVILLEAKGNGELSVSWSDGKSYCEAKEGVNVSWGYLQAATINGLSETSDTLSMDPNQAVNGVTISFLRRLSSGEYLISYPSKDFSMPKLVAALNEILTSCDIDIEFSYTWISS